MYRHWSEGGKLLVIDVKINIFFCVLNESYLESS